MIRNTLYLLMACCLLASCDDYEWDTKMIVEGRVVDQSGNPKAGIYVSTQIVDDGSWNSGYEPISYTRTDAQGIYRMMFPRPKREDDILVMINTTETYNPYDTAFSHTVIRNIKQTNFDDHLLSLGDHVVFPADNTTTLTLTSYNDPAIEGEISNVNIDALSLSNHIDYNSDYAGTDFPSPPINPVIVATNQTVILRYTIRTGTTGAPEYTTTEVPVQIGSDPVTYTINY